MVNTKEVDRRPVEFRSLEDVRADLDRIQAGHDAGTLRASGNWSPGQVLEHVAILMECAVDGFPSYPPAPVRWIVSLLYKKKALRGDPPPAGFKIPSQASFLVPGENTTFEEGMGRLRGIVDRVLGGARFTHPSPIFGKLTHEEWVTLQCGHAGLHLSFLHPEG